MSDFSPGRTLRCIAWFDSLLQIHSFHWDQAVPQHIDRRLALFQDDISDQRFVITVCGFHVDEENLVVIALLRHSG